jgi:hypothetical protein
MGKSCPAEIIFSAFHDFDFVLRQAVKLIDQPVNLPDAVGVCVSVAAIWRSSSNLSNSKLFSHKLFTKLCRICDKVL